MTAVAHILSVLLGFSSGIVVSGAVFAFITVVGVVPRLAQKTRTTQHVKFYESAISAGGVFGALTGLVNIRLPLGWALAIPFGLANGIFFGTLAMSLAEVLNVIPILTRRGRIQHGMFYLVLAIAIGKMIGALLYFLLPGFYDSGNM
ncbi:MAG: stage V sporulation protein AB [Defluviitaleaceae bacterium]|nr:stage V sporulation protein AB [Defluviitaleaceae bacterium]